MDQPKGALLRAHTAEEAAKPPMPQSCGLSEPGANYKYKRNNQV